MCECKPKVEEEPKKARYAVTIAPFGDFWIEPQNCNEVMVETRGHMHLGRSVLEYGGHFTRPGAGGRWCTEEWWDTETHYDLIRGSKPPGPKDEGSLIRAMIRAIDKWSKSHPEALIKAAYAKRPWLKAKEHAEDVMAMIECDDRFDGLDIFYRGNSQLFDSESGQIISTHLKRIERTMKKSCPAIRDALQAITRNGAPELATLLDDPPLAKSATPKRKAAAKALAPALNGHAKHTNGHINGAAAQA
jgi:hypothetical protein